jgi:D-threo-aldose 1-dehydrogenase
MLVARQQMARIQYRHIPLRHPAVASVLTGAASVKELHENITNFDIQVPDHLWSQMEDEGLISKIPK